MQKEATFSRGRKYRYTLWRRWGGLFHFGYAMFIGLNPSIVDETRDDPTIRRCIGYARDWGYGALCMTNLFAFRATLPTIMKAVKDPVGPRNMKILSLVAREASIVIAAWGIDGSHLGQDDKVRELIPKLSYLALTQEGYPSHPLYLPKKLTPIVWKKE